MGNAVDTTCDQNLRLRVRKLKYCEHILLDLSSIIFSNVIQQSYQYKFSRISEQCLIRYN